MNYESNEQEERGLFDELFTEPEQQQEKIETKEDDSPKVDLKEIELLRSQVEKQNQEIADLRKVGSKLDKLHLALSDEKPDPELEEARRLTEEYDRDPGMAVLKLKKEMKDQYEQERNAEKRAIEYRFLKRELSQEYDINFDDPKVAQAIVDELNTMDKSFKEKDMKGALVRAMRLSGNDKKRQAPYFADSSSFSQQKEKSEAEKIREGMKVYRTSNNKGEVFSHIFGK